MPDHDFYFYTRQGNNGWHIAVHRVGRDMAYERWFALCGEQYNLADNIRTESLKNSVIGICPDCLKKYTEAVISE